MSVSSQAVVNICVLSKTLKIIYTSTKTLSRAITRNSNFSVARECKDAPEGGGAKPPLGIICILRATLEKLEFRVMALEKVFVDLYTIFEAFDKKMFTTGLGTNRHLLTDT